jgi:Na+-driven multidrug efflux pump
VNGLAFTVRSLGFAFNEVVVSLLENPGAAAALQRFAWGIAIVGSLVLGILAATPLAAIYFADVSALPAHLQALAGSALWILVPLPAITALQSLYQGALVHHRRTRAVTESVLVFLFISVLVQGVGVALQKWTGLYVAFLALVASNAAQLTWLWWRGRHAYVSLTGPAAPESLPLSDPPTS